MLIRSRSTRVSQPTGPVEIDWSNPICRGLVFAHLPTSFGRNLVNGLGPAYSAGVFGVDASVNGRSVNLNTAGLQWDIPPTTETFSVLTLSDGYTVSDSPRIGVFATVARAGFFINYETGALRAFTANSGSFVNAAYTVTASNSRRACIIAVANGSANRKIYVDGIERGLNGTNLSAAGCTRVCFNYRDGATINTQTFSKKHAVSAVWSRSLTPSEIASIDANPWQLFRPVERRVWFSDVGGGGAGNATGSLAAISLSAATGSGTGSASASSAPAAVWLTAPQGTASGGATGFASGAPAAVSLSAPTASAVGSASATGALAGVSLSAPQASAQGAASASGTLDGIDLSAPTANATGGAVGLASGALAPISLTAAAGSASGSAIASAAYAGITLNAPTGSASAGQVGFASGALAPIGATAPQGLATGAAAAFAAYTGITLTPAEGAASATSPVGNAAGALRAISLTAATATASGGFPPLTNEEMRELLDTVRLLKIQLQQVNGYTSLIPALL